MTESLAIVALYAGLNALILVALTVNIGPRRVGQKALNPGDTGDAQLTSAIRAHANFTEYAPIVLVLLLCLALTNTAALPLHILGGTFTFARIAHGIGMMQPKHPNPLRFIGAALTVLVLLSAGALCLLRFYESLSP